MVVKLILGKHIYIHIGTPFLLYNTVRCCLRDWSIFFQSVGGLVSSFCVYMACRRRDAIINSTFSVLWAGCARMSHACLWSVAYQVFILIFASSADTETMSYVGGEDLVWIKTLTWCFYTWWPIWCVGQDTSLKESSTATLRDMISVIHERCFYPFRISKVALCVFELFGSVCRWCFWAAWSYYGASRRLRS